MLRSLLAERFHVAVHMETRELPIYALVVARRDGKLGPQLHPSEDCTALPRRTSLCGGRATPGHLTFGGMPISALFQPALLREVQRTVVDRTGLTGFFDGSLQWTPGEARVLAFGDPPPDTPPPIVDGPSIFTALEEQLGLKLEPGRGPVEVLVIDRVDHLIPD
jgi:uncharacterized protein (TIGR03435 family)